MKRTTLTALTLALALATPAFAKPKPHKPSCAAVLAQAASKLHGCDPSVPQDQPYSKCQVAIHNYESAYLDHLFAQEAQATPQFVCNVITNQEIQQRGGCIPVPGCQLP